MQIHSLPTFSSLLPGAAEPAQQQHSFTLHSPTFDGLASLRSNIKKRLNLWQINGLHVDKLQLSVCEIVTNLIKHPDIKADTIYISLRIVDKKLHADIADNGSPFASFDAKCTIARHTQACINDLREGGYGLSLILQQHEVVTYMPATESPDGFNHFVLCDPVLLQKAEPQPFMLPAYRGQNSYAEAQQIRQTVFIIDDDRHAASQYMAGCREYFTVHIFSDAETALAQFSKLQPALIICDLALHGMDGVTLRRHLSSLEGGDLIPFVYLGNDTTKAYDPCIAQAGIDDYLCKPVSPERMLAVATRLIERTNRFTTALQGKLDAQITAMLHPQLPGHHRNWHIATRSVTAEAGGGDFTIYTANEHGFMATLSDVMGHGLQAKFFAYAYAGYLRSLMHMTKSNLQPADFLTRISGAVMADSFLDSTIITCLAFSLGDKGIFSCASAGHPPPWHIRNSAEAHAVDISGPIPGLLGESSYAQKDLCLHAGEKIIIGTDGFWDCWDNPRTLSEDLRSAAHLDIATYTDTLWQQAYHRANARHMHKDDTTLIVIEAGEPS